MEGRGRRRNRSRTREKPFEINISTSDMSSRMQNFIMEQVIECLNNRSHPKKMCRYIRERCNERYGPSWDCFVAREYYGWVNIMVHFMFMSLWLDYWREPLMMSINIYPTFVNYPRKWRITEWDPSKWEEPASRLIKANQFSWHPGYNMSK